MFDEDDLMPMLIAFVCGGVLYVAFLIGKANCDCGSATPSSQAPNDPYAGLPGPGEPPLPGEQEEESETLQLPPFPASPEPELVPLPPLPERGLEVHPQPGSGSSIRIQPQ